MFNWVCLYGLEIHVSHGVAVVGLSFWWDMEMQAES